MNNVDSKRLGYYLSEQTIEILEKLSTHLGLFMCVNYSHEHSMADHFASQVIDTLDHTLATLVTLLPPWTRFSEANSLQLYPLELG